jgi:hypothetical protein
LLIGGGDASNSTLVSPQLGRPNPELERQSFAGLALLGSADMFDAKQVDQDIAVFYFYNVSLIRKQGEWRAVGLT